MKLLTTEQAAEVLQIPKATLIRWRVEGVGPDFFKLGSAVRYAENDLQRWTETKRHTFAVRAEEAQNVSV